MEMTLTTVRTSKYCNNHGEVVEVTTSLTGNELSIHTDRHIGTATITRNGYQYEGIYFQHSLELMEYALDDGTATVYC